MNKERLYSFLREELIICVLISDTFLALLSLYWITEKSAEINNFAC